MYEPDRTLTRVTWFFLLISATAFGMRSLPEDPQAKTTILPAGCGPSLIAKDMVLQEERDHSEERSGFLAPMKIEIVDDYDDYGLLTPPVFVEMPSEEQNIAAEPLLSAQDEYEVAGTQFIQIQIDDDESDFSPEEAVVRDAKVRTTNALLPTENGIIMMQIKEITTASPDQGTDEMHENEDATHDDKHATLTDKKDESSSNLNNNDQERLEEQNGTDLQVHDQSLAIETKEVAAENSKDTEHIAIEDENVTENAEIQSDKGRESVNDFERKSDGKQEDSAMSEWRQNDSKPDEGERTLADADDVQEVIDETAEESHGVEKDVEVKDKDIVQVEVEMETDMEDGEALPIDELTEPQIVRRRISGIFTSEFKKIQIRDICALLLVIFLVVALIVGLQIFVNMIAKFRTNVRLIKKADCNLRFAAEVTLNTAYQPYRYYQAVISKKA